MVSVGDAWSMVAGYVLLCGAEWSGIFWLAVVAFLLWRVMETCLSCGGGVLAIQ